ncbi:MAG: YdjY domain-containing protein [Phycisphaerales bacterium]
MALTLLPLISILLANPAATQPESPAPAPAPAPAPPAPPAEGLVEVFPSVRVDRAARVVEFDSTVIAGLADPNKKLYLEVLACPRDSKEHESLVMTLVKPSQVHAAMLLAGFKPGRPVTWPEPKPGEKAPAPTPPEGDAVAVTFAWTDPATKQNRTASPLEWVVNAKTNERASALNAGFVFAGSVIIKRANPAPGQPPALPPERYDADSAGTLIGLASFGSETIAWTQPFSPESSIAEPVWIADRERVPPLGTKVVVRLAPDENSK